MVFEVHTGLVADHDAQRLQPFGRTDGVQDVAHLQPCVMARDLDHAAARETRHDHARSGEAGHFAEFATGEVVVAHFEVARRGRRHGGEVGGLGVGDFFFDVHAEPHAYQNHGYNDADDAEGIRDRVGESLNGGCVARRADFAQRLPGGGEAGRIGRGARKQADSRRHINEAGDDPRRGHGDAEQHVGRGEEIEDQAARSQRSEKAGTDLKSQGVNEEDQSEFAHEFEHVMIEGEFKVPEGQACEQDAGRAEPDVADLDFANRDAGAARDSEEDDRTCDGFVDEEMLKPVHNY